jgi:tetratricopeptide (TPR) repeat protein
MAQNSRSNLINESRALLNHMLIASRDLRHCIFRGSAVLTIIIASWSSAGSQQADNHQALVKQMEQQIDMGHPEAVLDQLKENTTTPGVARVRGEALYAMGRYSEADQALSVALRVNPDDSTAVKLRGLTLFRLGRPTEAIPLLERSSDSGASTQTDLRACSLLYRHAPLR